MLLTEEEATKKGCCQPLVYDEVGEMEARPVSCAGKCIASGCMAWRWSEKDCLAGCKGGTLHSKSNCMGYCGLAGKPE